MDLYGAEYLRTPSEVYMCRIIYINSARLFPGFLCSDCQHFEWENCPIVFAGQFKVNYKKPTVVLKSIVDSELFIWAANCGWPGSLYKINILDSYTILKSGIDGEMLPDFSNNLTVV